MAWNPLGSIFKGNDDVSKRVKAIAMDLAIKYEVEVDVLLIAWILKHPSGVLPVCGTTDPQRIGQLMLATTLELELQDWFSIWVESVGTKVP